jgi:hypothetical protein
MVSDKRAARGIRALCVAVDARAYSGRSARGQHLLQTALVGLLEEATEAAGLDRVSWDRQPQGDGELALVPADQDEFLVVDDFVRRLHEKLFAYNEERTEDARLRLRVAMHFGIALVSANGYAGPAPVDVSRILASDELHGALDDAPDSDLVVALSDSLYKDLILSSFTSLRPEAFQGIEIKNEKFEGRAWIRVLRPERASVPAAATEPGSASSAGSADGPVHRSEVVNHFHGPMNGGVAGIQNNFGSGARR